MKKTIIIICIVLVLVGGGYFYMQYMGGSWDDASKSSVVLNTSKPDIQNIKYTVEGEVVGLNTAGVESGATMVGMPTYGDIDADGDADGAVWLTKKYGENENIFYAAVAINESKTSTESGVTTEAKAPNAVLLGDNIQPKSIEVKNGQTIYTFLDQVPNTSPTSTPTVTQSVAVDYDTNTGNLVVGTVAPTPVPPQNMTLDMKQWKWVETISQSGEKTYPSATEGFTVNLQSLGVFNATADCNVVGGVYTTTGSNIEFSQMKGTGLSCSRSNESVFWNIFENAESYTFNSSSQLVFNLGSNGTAIFK